MHSGINNNKNRNKQNCAKIILSLKKTGLADSESIVTRTYYVICIKINICSHKSSVSLFDKMSLFNLTIYFFVLSMQVFALNALFDYFDFSKYKNMS